MSLNRYTKTAIVFAVAFGYAIVRYHVFGPHVAAQIPSYLLNKGASFAAVFYLLFSAHARFTNDLSGARYWGKASLVLAALHVFLSFPLWSFGYYDSFFMTPDFKYTDMMNMKGEIALLTGAVASVVYLMISSRRPRAITFLMTIAVTMVCMHVGVMGVMGWFTPEKWHGGLPPITLLSFLVAVPCYWFLWVRQPTFGTAAINNRVSAES